MSPLVDIQAQTWLHVGGEVSLVVALTLSDGWLRISVADGSAIHPVLHELSGHQPRGRGMRIVAALAARWECEDHHGGKRVWVELRSATSRTNLIGIVSQLRTPAIWPTRLFQVATFTRVEGPMASVRCISESRNV